MKRYFFWALVICFSLTIGYHILRAWRGIVLSQRNSSKESLLRATEVDPGNPVPFHRLALLHQWNLLQLDLNESSLYLRKAIQRNPLEQQYWLHLAKAFQGVGEKGSFQRALQNAILVFPTGYEGRWVAGNLFLLQGSMEEAIPHFSYILSAYPEQSAFVYDIWGKVVDDSDFILERLVPKTSSCLNQYLLYLYATGDRVSAEKVWRKKLSLGYPADRNEILRYIEFLISQGDFGEAYQVWTARLREEGLPTFSDGNLITNSSFEKEKLLGGGFDWKIENPPGARVSYDPSVSFEGKRSLKITFNGKENIDFHHIRQLVPLNPETNYLLRAHMKSEGVTTKSGLKIEIYGVGPAFYESSEMLTGDNEWRELVVPFRTPAQSKGGVVRVRREKTEKFDRFISGTVWIDDVQLIESH
jgi:hypothetical protein